MLNVGDNETIENIDIELKRGGVITVSITDSSGRPLLEEQVDLMRFNESGKPAIFLYQFGRGEWTGPRCCQGTSGWQLHRQGAEPGKVSVSPYFRIDSPMHEFALLRFEHKRKPISALHQSFYSIAIADDDKSAPIEWMHVFRVLHHFQGSLPHRLRGRNS